MSIDSTRSTAQASLLNFEGQLGLNCAFYGAAFWHADLRVSLPEGRQEFRDVSVDARQAIGDLSKGTLPATKMGPRQSETPSRHWRGNYFQRFGFLHYRLSKQGVSGSGDKRITERGSWRKICYRQGIENADGEKINIAPSD